MGMEGRNDDLVAATKSTLDGEPVTKHHRPTICIPSLLNPTNVTPFTTKTTKATKNKAGAHRKTKKSKAGSDIREQVGKHNLLEELARAASGITFGLLAHVDAEETTKELRRLLKIWIGHTLVAQEHP